MSQVVNPGLPTEAVIVGCPEHDSRCTPELCVLDPQHPEYRPAWSTTLGSTTTEPSNVDAAILAIQRAAERVRAADAKVTVHKQGLKEAVAERDEAKEAYRDARQELRQLTDPLGEDATG